MAAASRSACQAHGSSPSSSWALVRPKTTRSSALVSHAKGSTSTVACNRFRRTSPGSSSCMPARRASGENVTKPPSRPHHHSRTVPSSTGVRATEPLLAVAGTLAPSRARLLQHFLLVLGGRQLRSTGPGRAHVLALGSLVVGAQELLLMLGRRHPILDGTGSRARSTSRTPCTRGDTVAGGAAGLLALVLRHGSSRPDTKGKHDRKGGGAGRRVMSTQHG